VSRLSQLSSQPPVRWPRKSLFNIVMVPQLRVLRGVRPVHDSILLQIVDDMVALALV
jgi:hypothetical protein